MKDTPLILWSEYLSQIRLFFKARGFYEVTTPSLVEVGAFQSSLDCLPVRVGGEARFLPTSPEIEMKFLFSQNPLPIYQISKAYREDPITPHHRKEFMMLEFYRPNATYLDTQKDMKDLFQAFLGKVDFKERTMQEWIREASGIDYKEHPSPESLRQAMEAIGISTSFTQFQDLFFTLLGERVEPTLNPQVPTLIKDYPLEMSALGKVNDEKQITERFEIYWQGMEICNGCTELDSPEELKSCYHRESLLRQQEGKTPHPYPHRLETAIRNISAPYSGVAVGLGRLFKGLHPEIEEIF